MINNKNVIVSDITSALQVMERNNFSFLNIISSNSAGDSDGIIFFKPEICSIPPDKLNEVLTYFYQMIELHSIYIRNIYIVTGIFLLKYNILDKNYESIKNNSLLSVTKNEKDNVLISSILDKYSCSELKGGLFLAQQGYSSEYLIDLWKNSGQVIKIATDFYGVPCTINNTRTLLVNAFYPFQIEQYQTKDSKIILFTFNSETSFIKLKKYFQGSAECEGRFKTSLREYLTDFMGNHLLGELTPSINGIHLSASREEGRKEIKIFFDIIHQYAYEGKSFECRRM